MRRICRHFFAVLLALVALGPPGTGAAWAQDPGFEPQRITDASKLELGHGAVIISVRSELFLRAELDLYFVRDGGDVANDADVVRFQRAQPLLALSNATTKYKLLSVQMLPGRYRLAGHGAMCPKVPAPDERCLVDVKILGLGETVSYPSRGYGEDAPVFEVRAGALTVAGDFSLTARNRMEWSPIPADTLDKVAKRFASLPRGPEPEVNEDFLLQYPLRPRSYSDDAGRRY